MSVFRCTPSGGKCTLQTVAGNLDNTQSVLVSGDLVYFVDAQRKPNARILVCHARDTACVPQEYVALPQVSAITQDATRIYATSDFGRVYGVPKPD